MRSSADMKQRLLEVGRRMVLRPEMYAPWNGAADVFCQSLLGDLCFLDERDDSLNAWVERRNRCFGQSGICGAFGRLWGAENNAVAEIASVYAEELHRLGYLPTEGISADRWQIISAFVDSCVKDKDIRRSEVEAAIGTPSLIVSDRVLCYAPSDGSEWLFIDCWPMPIETYEPHFGRYDLKRDADPLVRAVRRTSRHFREGVALTLLGKVLRHGTGWWVDHPDASMSPEEQAIAAQLRSVEVT